MNVVNVQDSIFCATLHVINLYMAFHVIHYGEVKVLLLDLAAKREWVKIIFSNSERVMHCVTKISALVLTGAHDPFSVKNKKKRSADRG